LCAGVAQSLDFVLAFGATSNVPGNTPALPASQITARKQRDLYFGWVPYGWMLPE
jgi:hypothetical protein